MRKLLFIASIAIGGMTGLLASIDDDWGTRAVMVAVGVLFATAIGSAFLGGLRRHQSWPADDPAGMSASMDELSANFWRDRGHPPFTRPRDALPDRHMFEPDKLD